MPSGGEGRTAADNCSNRTFDYCRSGSCPDKKPFGFTPLFLLYLPSTSPHYMLEILTNNIQKIKKQRQRQRLSETVTSMLQKFSHWIAF